MNFQSVKAFFASTTPRTKQKFWLSVIALAVAAALLLLNLLIGFLPWGVRHFAFQDNAAFGISYPTKSLLHSLEEEVRIYLVTEDGELNTDRDLYSFIKDYEALTSCVEVGTVSTKADPAFFTSRGLDVPEEIAFLIESDRRCRLVLISDLYYYECVNSVKGEELTMRLTPDEYAAYGQSLLNSGCTITPYFNAESSVTNAIAFVTREDVPTVAVVESDTNYKTDGAWLSHLLENGYEIEKIASVADLSAKHDFLLFNTPLTDVTEPEANALSAWLEAGGDMFLTTYYRTELPSRLGEILNAYGLSADETGVRLVENDKNYAISAGSDSYMYAKIASSHEVSSGFNGVFLSTDSHAIKIEVKQGVSTTPWLYTTESGSRERYNSSTGGFDAIAEDRAAHAYGVIAERDESSVIWVSTPYAFSRDFDLLAEGSNFELLLSAFDWANDHDSAEAQIEIEPSVLESTYLAVPWTSFVVWGIILVILLPGSLVFVGILRRYVRKRKI